MNWIIQSDYNDYSNMCCKDSQTESDKNRIEELESNINYYERTYCKGGNK